MRKNKNVILPSNSTTRSRIARLIQPQSDLDRRVNIISKSLRVRLSSKISIVPMDKNMSSPSLLLCQLLKPGSWAESVPPWKDGVVYVSLFSLFNPHRSPSLWLSRLYLSFSLSIPRKIQLSDPRVKFRWFWLHFLSP